MQCVPPLERGERGKNHSVARTFKALMMSTQTLECTQISMESGWRGWRRVPLLNALLGLFLGEDLCQKDKGTL